MPRAKSLQEIVGHLRPYNTPPPPVPLDVQAAARKDKSARRATAKSQGQTTEVARPADRTYKATIYLRETTGADGTKNYLASSTPMKEVEIPESPAVGPVEEAQTTDGQAGDRHMSKKYIPYRVRMRERHQQFFRSRANDMLDQRRDRAKALDEMREKTRIGEPEKSIREKDVRKERGKIHALSVKRQRKLKMKKHKYKKLMKRTRTLRRKLERN